MFANGNYNVLDDLIGSDLKATQEAFETTVIPSLKILWDNMVGKGALVEYDSLDAGFEFDESNSALPTKIKFRMGFILEDFTFEEDLDDGAVIKDKQTISKYFSQFEGVECSLDDVEIVTPEGSCRITVHMPISTTTFILDSLKKEKEEQEKRDEERLKHKDEEVEKDEYGFNIL